MSKALFKSLAVFSIIISFLAQSFNSAIARPSQKYRHKQKPIPAILNYKPGEVLVKFKKNVSASKQKSVAQKAGGEKTIKNLKVAGKQVAKVVEVKEGVSVESAVKKFEADNSVEYAEPNYINRISYAINDPSFSGNQWAFNNTGQVIGGVAGTVDADIDALEAWDVEDGSSNPVTVAIIDSGMDTNHEDLSAKIWQNTDETAGDNDDDDGNGYKDDSKGYNFAGISQYANNLFWSMGGLGTNEVVQSIKGTGQPLTHIGLLLSKVGSPPDNLTVSVKDTLSEAALPLESFVITRDEVETWPNYDEVYKPLSGTVNLTNGSPYYIFLKTTGSTQSNSYIYGDNSDQDPNTYEEDPYVEGNEYVYNGVSFVPYDNDDLYFRTNPNANPRDDNGHGTHVAGIVGAQTNNSTGVAGTSPGAKLMALKAGDASGSLYTSDIIEAINYAADNGAKIINMSFGETSSSASQQQAETDAYNAGVTLFAASGNSYDSTMQYPAGHSNIIGVGATTNQDQKASFSTYNSSVDISAPGSYIYSTMPTYAVAINGLNYAYLSGTSMSTPMAAGVGALVLSQNQTFTPRQVQIAMQAYADDKGASGRDNSFGYGRINAYATLNGLANDVSAPSTPSTSSTTHPYTNRYYKSNDPYVSWSASDASGIWGYSYTYNKTSDTVPDQTVDTYSTAKKYYDKGPGKTYFHVRARDVLGNWGLTGHRRIIIDSYKPRTYAPYSRRVRRGQRTRLYWKVGDPYTGNRAYVTIVIQRKIGSTYKTVKKVRYGLTAINYLRYYLQQGFTFQGIYRFLIYATDRAGNKQYNVARNYVRVY